MNSKRNTGHERSPDELTALLQLRLMLADSQLNQILPREEPVLLARRYCHPHITTTLERRVASALRELAQLNVSVVTVADSDYPDRLEKLEKLRPPILFYRGNYDFVTQRAIAIVGMRRSTEYGNSVAEQLAGELAAHDVGIVSGLALGVDTYAHRGAIAMNGRTAAVLGCGIDVSYPPRNARLQEHIATHGLLLSEFAPGTPAMPHHFLQRNRLIALLADAVVVVEAGLKSGTYKTVEWALDYNVTVFAVPGPIGRETSSGTNAMIRDGAVMLTSLRDVLAELKWPALPKATSPATSGAPTTPEGRAGAIFNVLSGVALHIDDLARAARCSTAEALAILAQLELNGLVRQLPGKRFARVRVLDGS